MRSATPAGRDPRGLALLLRSSCIAPLAIALATSAGCGEEGRGGPVPSRQALIVAVDDTVVPAMEAFSEEAEALAAAVGPFCEDPAAASLDALRDGWLTTSLAWNRAALYYLGPLDDDPITPAMYFVESMRQRGIDYTDTVRDAMTAAVQGDETLDASFFEALNFNRVGLLALEVLLFEDSPRAPGTTELAAVAAGYAESLRKCAYLDGVAGLLRERARDVERGWTESFGDTSEPFRDLLVRGALEDGALPEQAVLVAMIRHVEYVRARKLEALLDARLATEARPDSTPFWANVEAGLAQLEAFLGASGPAAPSFFEVMADRGYPGVAAALQEDIERARSAVRAGDRDAAAAAFATLEDRMRQELPRAVGVNIGLNFSDGD